MDRGILYTLKSLMLRPGRLIGDYLEGRRANHVKPLLLIMITAAAVVFLGRLLGRQSRGGAAAGGHRRRARGWRRAGADAMRLARVFEGVRDWMNLHIAALMLILLPFEAFAFKLAFRRYRELNYPDGW